MAYNLFGLVLHAGEGMHFEKGVEQMQKGLDAMLKSQAELEAGRKIVADLIEAQRNIENLSSVCDAARYAMLIQEFCNGFVSL